MLIPRMDQALDRFQHRVVRRLSGRQPRRRGYGSWDYPPLEEAMGEAGFKGVRKYITRRKNLVS